MQLDGLTAKFGFGQTLLASQIHSHLSFKMYSSSHSTAHSHLHVFGFKTCDDGHSMAHSHKQLVGFTAKSGSGHTLVELQAHSRVFELQKKFGSHTSGGHVHETKEKN